MRVIQPYPHNDSPLPVVKAAKIPCPMPVRFVKYRYKHHAAPSGYDRVCDFIDAPIVPLPKQIYWLGETLLRPFALWNSKLGGKWEYSRYDYTMELAVIWDFFRQRSCIYHFIYSEKSFHLLERFTGKRGHRFIGTVHHPPEDQDRLFRTHDHFRVFDHLIAMDKTSVKYWEQITGKKNVTWIPHGVDTNFFRPSDTEPEPSPSRIIFAGHHDRDFETLREVLKTTMLKIPNVRIDLVGDHPVLCDLATQFPQVCQHKNLSDSSYRDLLQKSHILLLPLVNSTVSNVVLEALACGTPVVTNKGGINDYLDESCSATCHVGDVSSMAQAIVAQLSGSSTKTLSRAAARKTACRFSWQSVAQRHVELYGEI